jgi:hypothetical protein
MSFGEKLLCALSACVSDMEYMVVKIHVPKIKNRRTLGSGGGEFQFSMNGFRRYWGRAAT